MGAGTTLGAALAVVAIVTFVLRGWWHLANPTTAALCYLLVVVILATVSRVWAAMVVAVVADLALNYFFMPPFGTLAIEDPQNWVALAVFLAVSVLASSLSSAARDRAVARRGEQLKSTLLASLGHHLRTPLTAIRVAASNAASPWIEHDERRVQADIIQSEVARLDHVVNHLLDMARIEAGHLPVERQWIAAGAIYDAARDQVRPALESRDVVVTADTEHFLHLDPRLTASALAHVLENALQYSPAGTPIAVDLSVAERGLTVRVRDHGPGLGTDEPIRLFDRFTRGAAGEQAPSGTGMGLAIARGFLEVQGGSIAAANAPGGGALFTLAVPAAHKLMSSVEDL